MVGPALTEPTWRTAASMTSWAIKHPPESPTRASPTRQPDNPVQGLLFSALRSDCSLSNDSTYNTGKHVSALAEIVTAADVKRHHQPRVALPARQEARSTTEAN